MAEVKRDAFGFPTQMETVLPGDPLLEPTISKPNREEFRAAEIQKVIDEGQSVLEEERPILWLMGGGSGSGKSTVLQTLRDDGFIPVNDVVHIDPDAFKKVIPEFEELIKRKDGRAAIIVHDESTLMAREAFARAVSKRADIIYDTTLSNFPKAGDMIAHARSQGYEVRIIGVTASPRTAIERVVKRGDRTGRYVPIRDLLSTHKKFAAAFEQYIELVDSISLWKTDCGNGTLKKIASKTGGHFDIILPAEYNEFRKSANLNEDATTPDEIDRGEEV